MKKMSMYHITWYIAIASTIVLAMVVHVDYWYVPLIVYFVGATLSIFIMAIFHGTVKYLPACAKKAFKSAFNAMTEEKHPK